MSVSARYLLFQVVIILPFLIGTLSRRRFTDTDAAAKRLIRLNLVCVEPFIALWSIWGLALTREMALLPLSGVLIVLAGMAAGRGVLSIMPLEGRSRATFLISSSIANHGFTMGGFICYLFFGQRGLGLAALFLSYFLLYVFTVIFPYARLASTGEKMDLSMVRGYLLDLQNMPLFATLLGIALQALGVDRPAVAFPIDLFMVVSVSIYYFCMGLSFQLSDMLSSNRENAILALLKFMAVPAVAAVCLSFLSIDPQVKGVILIQSFMPAAIYSVVASVLFNLE
jgi:predicted permease